MVKHQPKDMGMFIHEIFYKNPELRSRLTMSKEYKEIAEEIVQKYGLKISVEEAAEIVRDVDEGYSER